MVGRRWLSANVGRRYCFRNRRGHFLIGIYICPIIFSRRWKEFFGNEMDSADSLCDSAFLNSLEGKVVPSEYQRRPKVGVSKGISGSSKKMPRQNDKPVSSLDLKQPIVTLCNR